ncbi:glycosyltransferase [Paenibacillus sp. y28]|uniref:glycosyltransferase n=1 Tax=Paenibacillus sp. y28 TaxID=3129110 RepID=UPI0030158DF5
MKVRSGGKRRRLHRTKKLRLRRRLRLAKPFCALPGGAAAADTWPGAPGMNIIGYHRAETGLGESCRMLAQGLQTTPIPFAMLHVQEGNSARMSDRRWDHKEAPHPLFRMNVFHLQPDSFHFAIRQLGTEVLQGRFNIGYWHWDLPDLPDHIHPHFKHLHEVWVPSHFALDAVSRSSPVPVVRIPVPVHVGIPFTQDRTYFRLPEKSFLFLCTSDIRSSEKARLNPQGAIRAFQQAFSPHDSNVGLVVKMNGLDAGTGERDQIKQHLKGWPNIYVLDKTLGRSEFNALLHVCNAVISLHRSESVGLTLAEAMYIGKPVIGTNWSANTDFMNNSNSCPVHYEEIPVGQDIGPYQAHQRWADPDIEHAAHFMRRLQRETEWRKEIAAKGQITIRTRYSPEVCGLLAMNRLVRLGLW